MLKTTLRWLTGRPWPLLPLICLLLLAVFLAIGAYWDERQPRQPQLPTSFASALPLQHEYRESPTAFAFAYPEGWLYNIAQVNTLIIGPQALFRLEQAPSIVVHRNLGLISEGSLGAMMETYLRRGPLNGRHGWRQISEQVTTRIAERAALTVMLQGRDLAAVDSEELHIQITITQADNKMVYIFVATVPVAQLAAYDATLAAILASVEIRE